MTPQDFFLSLNKSGIPDEAWNYLQTEIIPNENFKELQENNAYYREAVRAINQFYPESVTDAIKPDVQALVASMKEPERALPEHEEAPPEAGTPEPSTAQGKPSMKAVKGAIKAIETAQKYERDRDKFMAMKQAVKALRTSMKYMAKGSIHVGGKVLSYKTIDWNSYHTLMGKVDMKINGAMFKKYKDAISNAKDDVGKINKITDAEAKRIISLGGRVKYKDKKDKKNASRP